MPHTYAPYHGTHGYLQLCFAAVEWQITVPLYEVSTPLILNRVVQMSLAANPGLQSPCLFTIFFTFSLCLDAVVTIAGIFIVALHMALRIG